MRVAIASDHGGFSLKEQVIGLLRNLGHEVEDQGCYSLDSVDYPDYAGKVCGSILDGSCERGILICGSGIGMSMAANRFSGIRAALCHELFTARLSREHNDANVLCLGARVIGPGLAEEMVSVWMATGFAGGRHQKRLSMFSR